MPQGTPTVVGVDAAAALDRVVAALPGGGEPRPGQRAMAEAVAAAIDSGRHLVVQAGTGTGKSLAYLVPAICSGRKVVVATATLALQDQLARKDLPFLADALDGSFRWCVLKGRANYLCLQKAVELGQADGDDPALDLEDLADDDTRRQMVRILEWARSDPVGDRAGLDFEPSPRTWASLSAGAEECPGAARCPMGESCFAEAARRRAEEADVVVVNTHLYALHLASEGNVLPDHDVVVFDEAHQLEDVACHAFGLELSAARFRGAARAVRSVLADGARAGELEGAGLVLDDALGAFRHERVPPGALAEPLAVARARLDAAAAALRRVHPTPGTKAAARAQRALKLVSSLADDVRRATVPDEREVAWVEDGPAGPVLRVASIDPGGRLAATLWSERTAILTSATIPPGLPARLGMPAGTFDTSDVGSPFAYREQALLYVARHLPDHRDPRYEAAMLVELEALIRAAGGRTLALFTSWRAMRAAVQALRPRLPWRLLEQAELPRPALLAAFASDETSCLFATMGFWQGVDVPGPAVSLVVLDRIPFPRPDEPLVAARREAAGDAAFATVDLPRAATLLAQGAGRLIRTATDRGVVAVLDRRLATMGYRRSLLALVPPMRRTVSRDEVVGFLAAGRAAG
jgi:ATP-dependent DNA helicase DinG